MTEVHVRHARAADADAIAGLLTQLGYPTASGDVPGRIETMVSGGRATVLVAEVGGAVVGLASSLVATALNRARDVCWLTALVVDESTRGKGVGRALVKAVEDLARNAGCERLTVTTQEHRTRTHAFYIRNDFEHTGRRFGKSLNP